MAAYANTVTSTMLRAAKVDSVTGFGMYVGKCDVTNYNSTLVAITAITGKFRTLMQVICTTISDNGYIVRWDASGTAFKAYLNSTAAFIGGATGTVGNIKDDNNAATVGHPIFVVPEGGPPVFQLTAESSSSGLVKDDDNASSLGVLVYLVIDDVEYLPGFNLGHLEFVSPTNAHGTCTIKSGGATLLLEDDDAAASNGTLLKAQAAGAGLISDAAGGNRTLVPVSNGKYLDVEDGTGGSPVQVYFDEDSSNTYERLVMQEAGSADEPYFLVEPSHLVVRPSPSMGRLARLVTTGPGATLSVGAASSGGPTFEVLHDAAAGQMVGAAPLNAIAAGAGFDCAVGGEQDVYIPVSNGEYIKITYAASPTGVQVYYNHDAANNYEKLTMVVVDNADETFNLVAPVATECPNDVDVGVVEFVAYGLV